MTKVVDVTQSELGSLNTEEKAQNETKAHSFLDLLKENLTCEMYHALLDIFDSSHIIIKVHLTFFLLTAYALASYTMVTLILSYLSFDVVTTTRIIYETPAVFPKVTICNLNQFTTKFAYDFLKSELDRTTTGILEQNQSKSISSFLKTQALFKLKYQANALLANRSQSFKQQLGHSLHDSLFSCVFNLEECKADDFAWEWDSYYGNCYSFNSGISSSGSRIDLKGSNLAGDQFGLQMDVYANFFEEFTFFNSIKGGSGLLIRLDNVSHKIDHSLEGIVVSAGSATNLALKREIRSSLPKPYSNCDLTEDGARPDKTYSDLFDLIVKSSYEYSQRYCLIQCFQQLTIRTCNCSISIFASLSNENTCASNEEIVCSFNIVYYNIYLKNNYIRDACLPQCPLECSSSEITYATSTYDLLGDTYLDVVQDNSNLSSDFIDRSITEENVKQSIVRLNIYYDTLSYKESEETPQMDIVTLIANIGGNLGLFLGVSMFSLCEIVTTLIEVYFYFKKG